MDATRHLRSTLIAAIATGIFLAGVATPGVIAATTPEPVVTVQTPTVEPNSQIIAGTFRRVDSTEWAMIDDAGHKPIGVDRIELRADRLRVWHTFRATQVVTMQVTPDESFAAAGVRVGASVGFAYTDVFFYMGASQTPVNPALLSKAGANVWITGLFLVP